MYIYVTCEIRVEMKREIAIYLKLNKVAEERRGGINVLDVIELIICSLYIYRIIFRIIEYLISNSNNYPV